MDATQLFIKSAYSGNVQEVQEFLKQGISVNVQDREGTTALQSAAANGYNDIVKLLLSRKANIELPNAYGWTSLMLAARHGHTSTVSLLLENRAKANASNKIGLTPISAAVMSGQLSTVKVLLSAGALVDHPTFSPLGLPECDLTPIMIASFFGIDVMLSILIERGAPVNQVSSVTGWSPLMLATCCGHKQAVETLIACGADCSVVDVCGQTALDIAILRNHHEVRTCLENATSGSVSALLKRKEFLDAVRNGNTLKVKSLLKNDPSLVDVVDPSEDMTALMLAAASGSLDIVKILVHNSANLNVQDSVDGWTSLMHAIFKGNVSVVKFLLEQGADMYIRAKNGYTAMDLAANTDDASCEILNALKSKFQSTSFKTGKTSLLTPTAFSRKKSLSSSSGTPSKHSPRSVRKKSWLGSFTGRLQTIFPKKSVHKLSDAAAIAPMIQINDAILNDSVFESSSTSDQLELTKPMLTMSALKSPDRLARNLKQHDLAPIRLQPLNCSWGLDEADKILLKKIDERNRNPQKSLLYIKPPRFARTSNLKFEPDENPATKISLKESHPKKSQKKMEESVPCSSNSGSFKSVVSGDALTADVSFAHHEELIDSTKECFVGAHGSNPASLEDILEKECLQKYIGKFKEQEVDLEAIQYLTEEDFRELSIHTMTSREKLLEIIEQLKKCSTSL